MNLHAIRDRLLNGDTVDFVAIGSSMTGKINNGDRVTVRPILPDDVLGVDSIVLAKVKGTVYLHKITAIQGKRIQIGNNKGHINGWTTTDKVYGVVVMIEYSSLRGRH